MKTKEQALEWLNSRIGKRLDVDGWYGSQCMDLTMGYCLFLTDDKWKPWGNAKSIKDNQVPAGWKLIENTPEFLPQSGDIAIWANPPYEAYGHTAVILSASLTSFQSIDQNWFNPSLKVGSPAALVHHNYVGFWGVLRPEFKEVKKKALRKPVIKKKAPVKKKEEWKRNSDGVLWKADNGKFKCTVSSGIVTRFNGPWSGWPVALVMKKGQTITFNERQDFDGYIWVSGKLNGKYVYVPIGYSNGNGTLVGKAWGTIL